MRKMRPQKQLLQFVILSLLSVVSVLVMANESFAALQCYNCHGQTNDMRPLDTTPANAPVSYRNITTGAVKGNHSEHMSATVDPTMCNRCHNNSNYTSSHRNGTISLKKGMNFSASGTYSSSNLTDAGTYVFKNQTSVPTLGTCSSVNCHFEKTTPTWGADPADIATVNCNTCHSSTPSSGSHTKHEAQYGGTASCVKCHAPRISFQHATSAGNVGRKIDLTSMTGPYSGAADKYLPSQTPVYGQCSTNYCHSSGQSFNGASATPTYKPGPVWGLNGSISCSSCHESNLINTGSHGKHIANDSECGKCHTGASNNGTTMNSATHVDGMINVDGTLAVNYSQGTSSTRGNGYGTCSNASCHSATTDPPLVTPTWGQVATCSSCHAASPVSGAHTKHIAMPLVTCDTCHTAVPSSTHVDGSVNVTLMAAPVPKHAPGVYTATCSTACHSTSTSAVATPNWGATATCSSCHEASPTTGAHSKHINAPVAAACGTCHAGAVAGSSGGSNHGNTNIDVSLYSPTSIAKHAPGVFTATCSTTCHSTSTSTVVTPTWGATATCSSCHEASPTTGSHSAHTAAPVAVACGVCHTGAVAGSNGGTGHGNGTITVAQGYPANVAKHAAGTYAGTCSTVCHSPFTTPNTTPIWGTPGNCDTCHSSSPTTGSHTKHIASGAGCATCHAAVGAAGHVNNVIDVLQNYPVTPKHAAGTYTGTCSTVCHSPFTNALSTTPVWGTASNCDSCHSSTPTTGSHTKHIASGTGCASCHTNPGIVGHINNTIDVSQSYPVTAKHVSGTYTGACSTTCHSSTLTAVSTPTWGTTTTCDSCHASSPVTGSHTKHIAHTNVTCASCHTNPGAVGHVNSNVSVNVGGYPTTVAKHAAGSGYNSCSNVSCHNGPASNPFTAPAATWGTSLDCAGCHGYPPVNSNHAGVLAGTCNSCHSNVVAGGTQSASTFVDVQLHLNHIVEGGKCDSCHGYPPVQSMVGLGTNVNYSSAKLQNYSGGGGVHSVAGHLALTTKYIAGGQNFSPCLTCHPQGATHAQGGTNFLTTNVQVVVDTQFKFDKNRPIVYNAKQSGTGKTSGNCTNVACHFQKSPLWSTQTYTQGH